MENERPTPLVEDHEQTCQKLASWLSEKRGYAVDIPGLTIPESSGMSNVTLLFDAHWRENGEDRSESCVGRLQPQIERPVFPSYDLGLQYEAMGSLGRNSDIPVPELRVLELDPSLLGVQFYVMKYTPGPIPGDMPPCWMGKWRYWATR